MDPHMQCSRLLIEDWMRNLRTTMFDECALGFIRFRYAVGLLVDRTRRCLWRRFQMLMRFNTIIPFAVLSPG